MGEAGGGFGDEAGSIGQGTAAKMAKLPNYQIAKERRLVDAAGLRAEHGMEERAGSGVKF